MARRKDVDPLNEIHETPDTAETPATEGSGTGKASILDLTTIPEGTKVLVRITEYGKSKKGVVYVRDYSTLNLNARIGGRANDRDQVVIGFGPDVLAHVNANNITVVKVVE